MELVPGLASFGRSGKNRPFWTGLNRPVQNPSIVQNCPKLSKTLRKAEFHQTDAESVLAFHCFQRIYIGINIKSVFNCFM